MERCATTCAVGRPEATDEEVETALRGAGPARTLLGPSPTASKPRCASAVSRLLAGERQLVSIARAALGRSVGARARRGDVEPGSRYRAPRGAGDGEADARGERRSWSPTGCQPPRAPIASASCTTAGSRSRIAPGARRPRRALRRALPHLVGPSGSPPTSPDPSSGRSRGSRTSSIRGMARAVWRDGWTPTPKMNSSGASNATSVKPADSNHFRTSGVRSGSRRWRVQITVAPGAESERDGFDRTDDVGVGDVAEHSAQENDLGRNRALHRPTRAKRLRIPPRRRAAPSRVPRRSCGGRAPRGARRRRPLAGDRRALRSGRGPDPRHADDTDRPRCALADRVV